MQLNPTANDCYGLIETEGKESYGERIQEVSRQRPLENFAQYLVSRLQMMLLFMVKSSFGHSTALKEHIGELIAKKHWGYMCIHTDT